MPDHVVGAVPCRTGRGDAGMNHDETNGPPSLLPSLHTRPVISTAISGLASSSKQREEAESAIAGFALQGSCT